jgi:hypothetical protein
VLDAAACWCVKRANEVITKKSATRIAAASATFTTMRSVNVTVGLQHLLRDAGDRAASAKVSNWGLMTRTHVRGELLAIRRRRSAGSESPANGREASPF